MDNGLVRVLMALLLAVGIALPVRTHLFFVTQGSIGRRLYCVYQQIRCFMQTILRGAIDHLPQSQNTIASDIASLSVTRLGLRTGRLMVSTLLFTSWKSVIGYIASLF